MLARAKAARPGARIDGFIVQEMIERPGALELIAGVVEDALFGPVVMFGHGGTAVEVLNDTTLELPPLNLALARAQMARTRVFRLMQGYRNQKPVDLAGVAQVLVHLSQLAADQAEITELDINPLLADTAGVIALDARIRVRPATQRGARRLAIRPYPKELESDGRLPDGTPLHLRPVRPEDEPALIALVERMAPVDLRMRFFTPMKSLTHELAAKLTQIDYDREVALVAEPPGGGEIWGVARFSADPDGVRAEYAIVVRSDLKGHGLGYLLMVRLTAVAKARGLQELFGNVLRQNEPMLAMASELGFETTNHPEEPDVVLVTKRL